MCSLHNSTYTGKAATIKRNTSGTVAATETAVRDGGVFRGSRRDDSTVSCGDNSCGDNGGRDNGRQRRQQLRPPDENYGPGFVDGDSSGSCLRRQISHHPILGLIAPNGQ